MKNVFSLFLILFYIFLCFFFWSQLNVFLVLFSPLLLLHLKEFSLFLELELKVLLLLGSESGVFFRLFFSWQRIAERQRKKCNKFYYSRCRMSISFNDFSPRQRQRPPVDRADLYLCAFDNAFLNSGSRSLCCLSVVSSSLFVFRSIAAGV